MIAKLSIVAGHFQQKGHLFVVLVIVGYDNARQGNTTIDYSPSAAILQPSDHALYGCQVDDLRCFEGSRKVSNAVRVRRRKALTIADGCEKECLRLRVLVARE